MDSGVTATLEAETEKTATKAAGVAVVVADAPATAKVVAMVDQNRHRTRQGREDEVSGPIVSALRTR